MNEDFMDNDQTVKESWNLNELIDRQADEYVCFL